MIFEQHYLDCLSQASYLIGDESSGKAVVVDPRRDVSPYLESAAEHGLEITMVIETHFHADFLSGHLELAAKTGAPIYYGSAAQTDFDSVGLADGECISLGEVKLEIRHTPGHTPESISIVIHETADGDPYGVLTGDALFVGDVGRPDLLSSIGMTSEDLASQLYDSLHNKLMTLPDPTRVYPAHGAGSACGKNLSSETSSTIGAQRSSNYAVQPMSKEAFVDLVTAGHTAPPAYFAFDAQLNREMRPVLDEDAAPSPLELDAVLGLQAKGVTILDTRDPDAFGAAHIAGSVNVGLAGRFAEFAGSVVASDSPIVLIADPGTELTAKIRLARIGFDKVVGHLIDPARLLDLSHEAVVGSSRVDVERLRTLISETVDIQLVDVRQPGETEGGVIEGATLIPLTRLREQLDLLDPTRPTAVYCAGGFRSSIAASVLMGAGFGDVCDVLGGYGAWQESTIDV
jgi:hydroxyacylglutathione hydrolase